MARTAFDATKPDGSSQAGTAFGTSTNANDKALRDAAVMGCMEGGDLTITVGTGTAAQPQYLIWKQGSNWLRVTPTWGAGTGTDGNWTAATYALSINGGSDYTTSPGGTIGTVTNSFDSSGNLTGTSGGGPSGVLTWVMSLMGKWKTLRGEFDTHLAGIGNTVHGLGTISTQAANNVALTGGAIDGVTIGATTRALATFKQAREMVSNPTFGATTTCDWSAAAHFYFTATSSGAATLAFSNLPASGIAAGVLVEITNGGLRTWTYPTGTNWGTPGAPTLPSSGTVVLYFITRDGGTNYRAGVFWS